MKHAASSAPPVRRDKPAVARIWPAHLLDQPMPLAQSDAALVIFVDHGKDASISWRHSSSDITYHCRHQDVACARTIVKAATLPGGGYASDFQFCRAKLATIAAAESLALVSGYAE